MELHLYIFIGLIVIMLNSKPVTKGTNVLQVSKHEFSYHSFHKKKKMVFILKPFYYKLQILFSVGDSPIWS